MLKEIRKMKGIWVVLAIVALFFVSGCDDSDSTPAPEPPAKVDKSTTFEDTSIVVDADGNLPEVAKVLDTSAATGKAVSEVKMNLAAFTNADLADGSNPAAGNMKVTIKVSDHDSEATYPEQSFGATDQMMGGKFVTAGFFSVEVEDADGKEITAFNPPLAFEMKIAPGTILPGFDTPVKAGDTVELWRKAVTDEDAARSADDISIKWVFVGNFTVHTDLIIYISIDMFFGSGPDFFSFQKLIDNEGNPATGSGMTGGTIPST